MGIREGVLLRADCGAEVIFIRACPDDVIRAPVCACGAEFAPDDDQAQPSRAADG